MSRVSRVSPKSEPIHLRRDVTSTFGTEEGYQHPGHGGSERVECLERVRRGSDLRGQSSESSESRERVDSLTQGRYLHPWHGGPLPAPSARKKRTSRVAQASVSSERFEARVE